MFSFPFTRRNALLGASAVAATTVIPQFSWSAGTVANRKNIESLSAAELSAYVHAIQITKDRSAANPNDPNGYLFWASYHDNFDNSIHSGCAHYSEKFFPWHRRYLADFEKLLQLTDPPVTAGVMIPYWDWSRPPTTGKHFPQAFEQPDSPLFDSRLNITPPPWDPNDIHTLVQEHDWNIFAGKPDPSDGFGTNPGSIESGPHNTLHTNISRDMAVPRKAVRDAIFWSFHAGIDLIWTRWQRLYVSDQHPQPFANPTALIRFLDRSFTVASTAKTADFLYDYDYDSSSDKLSAEMTLAAAAETTKIISPAKRVFTLLSATATGGPLTLGPPSDHAFAAASAVFRIADVKVFDDRSYRLNLYLHPKDIDLSSLPNSTRSTYLLRTITLWQAHHEATVELFVRPTKKQLSQLDQGWIVTILSELVPSGATPSELETETAPTAQTLPAISKLLQSVEIQER
jgi:hypothetical protein